MRKVSVIIILLLLGKAGFSQVANEALYADKEFLNEYSKITFIPGVDGKPIVRKWNQDIKLFVESNDTKFYKKRISEIIQKINPYLQSVKIVFAETRGDANCLVKIDPLSRTHYVLSWDENGNIYKSTIFLNTESVFNNTDQYAYISEYLMHILGDFHIPGKISAATAKRLHIDAGTAYDETVENIQSILKSRINGFTKFDFEVIQFHYQDNLKAGTRKDEFFDFVKNRNVENRGK